MYYMVMNRVRGQEGKFVQKSNQRREVRSLRLTDSAWNKLGELAEAQEMTRGDFIEKLMTDHVLQGDSLTLKPIDVYKVEQLEIPIQLIKISINQKQLAVRLNIKPHQISESKRITSGEKSLKQLSAIKDPDGIAWKYDSKSKGYIPAVSLTPHQSSKLSQWIATEIKNG